VVAFLPSRNKINIEGPAKPLSTGVPYIAARARFSNRMPEITFF
jgi:hypothetical protein